MGLIKTIKSFFILRKIEKFATEEVSLHKDLEVKLSFITELKINEDSVSLVNALQSDCDKALRRIHELQVLKTIQYKKLQAK